MDLIESEPRSRVAMDFECAVRFIVERGAAGPQHNSDVSLLEHVLGTYRVLERWNVADDVLSAGLFHSIYGTANFPIALASYDERETVRTFAGAAGERLAFLFCIKQSASLFELADRIVATRSRGARHESELALLDWRDGSSHAVTEREVIALVHLVAANAVEQVPRNGATLRRDLPYLLRASNLLCGDARAECSNESETAT